MAGTHDCAKTQDARGYCFSQQDGADNLGHGDQKRRLPGSGTGGGSMIDMRQILPDAG